MKKNVRLGIGLIIVIALVVGGYLGLKGNSSSSNNENSSSSKTLTVGTTGQTYPNTYYDKNKKLTGFDVDVTKAVAKKLGYKIKWKTIGDVPGLLTAVDSGQIDTVANAVIILPERQKKYDFSNTVAYYAAQIAVKKDSDYHSVFDLNGKTVSATLGSSNINLLKDYNPDIKIKTYDDRSAVFTDAAAGKVDGVLNQRQFLQEIIKKQHLDLRIINENIGWNEAAYPFAKTDNEKDLQKKFNKALQELQKDGTLTKLSQKYFNEDVTKKTN